jgi:hypothetical protein
VFNALELMDNGEFFEVSCLVLPTWWVELTHACGVATAVWWWRWKPQLLSLQLPPKRRSQHWACAALKASKFQPVVRSMGGLAMAVMNVVDIDVTIHQNASISKLEN